MTWIAYHLFYHGDRDAALTGFVAPLVETLWRNGGIESFFFVRYALGGPHLRLRFNARTGRIDDVKEAVESAASTFLARSPSIEAWSDEKIRQENRKILAAEPHETDSGIQADNSLAPWPVRFEIDRYGGPRWFPASLDFFALSSLAALRLLVAGQGEAQGRRLLGIFRRLARQAFGFAADEDELLALFEYALAYWPSLTLFAERGDRAFAAQPERFRQVLRQEAERTLLDPSSETVASHRLRAEIAEADLPTRRRILASQMHMTANRLGLLTPEEVYLGRLLVRSARDLADLEPNLWNGLRAIFAAPAAATPRLADLLPAAFADLSECALSSPMEVRSHA